MCEQYHNVCQLKIIIYIYILLGQKLVDLFLGKGSTKQRVQEATVTGLPRETAENIVAYLLVDGFLKEDFHFTPYSTLSYIVPGMSVVGNKSSGDGEELDSKRLTSSLS